MKQIYCITGATGFVGSNLVKKLTAQDETVYILARNEEKVKRALGETSARVFYGDVRSYDDIAQMLTAEESDGASHGSAAARSGDIQNPDNAAVHTQKILIHAAAIVSIGGDKIARQEMEDINLRGIQNAIDACLAHNVRLLYVSSVHAIPELKKRRFMTEITDFDPKKVVGGYARTKALGSKMVMEAIENRGLQAAMVHPSGITGPGDYGNGLLTQMVRDYLANRIPAAVKGGYDFVDVRDVCDGILAAIKNFTVGERYLLTNKYYTVKEILDYLHKLTGGKKINTVLPVWVAKLGLPFLTLGARLKKSRPLYTGYSLYTLKSNSNFNHSHATESLGFNPRELSESLKDTLAFLKEIDSNT